MTTTGRNRPGFALGLALMAIVIIGAMIVGAFFMSAQEYRVGRNAVTQANALAAAEYGQDTTLSGWNKAWNKLAIGSTIVRTYAPGGGVVDTVRITKLDSLSYLVVSEGQSGTGVRAGARRRTGLLLRLQIPQFTMPGAMTTRGNVVIGGATSLLGKDTSFAGWDCPPAGAAIAGVAVTDTQKLSLGGKCKQMSCISGSPLAYINPSVGDTSVYFNYGGLKWPDLVAMAEKSVSGTLTGVAPSINLDLSCNTGDLKNWGDPNKSPVKGACADYYPILYAPGDLTINGNVGQGMLLVGGNLNIQGGFNFYGPVIARGTVKLTGTGNHVNGGIMAASVIDSTTSSTLLGNSSIQYSRCTLNTVLRSTANPSRTRDRSWIDLY
ncbi:MAG TPA: hypothetical protein VKA84_25570 [Gemmatimonadaceae bacterium]|nr:hypothetical protein [Gemmatimonadaceae bacterium]